MIKRSLATMLLMVKMRMAPIGECEDLRGCIIKDLEASNSNYTLAWKAFLLSHIMMVIITMMMMMKVMRMYAYLPR